MCPLLKIARYYINIDNGEIETVLELFSPKARYERGTLILQGKSDVERFYRNERIIKSGNHIIKSIDSKENIVRVEGVFNGTLKSGEETSEQFEDKFEFENGVIIFRQTSFLSVREI